MDPHSMRCCVFNGKQDISLPIQPENRSYLTVQAFILAPRKGILLLWSETWATISTLT